MDIRKYITKKNVIIGAVAGTAIIGGIVALIVRHHKKKEIDEFLSEEEEAIAFNIKVDVFHSKRLFQKLIFTICIFIIPSPTFARSRKKPPMEGSFKSL